jgi:hypothetical protein
MMLRGMRQHLFDRFVARTLASVIHPVKLEIARSPGHRREPPRRE